MTDPPDFEIEYGGVRDPHPDAPTWWYRVTHCGGGHGRLVQLDYIGAEGGMGLIVTDLCDRRRFHFGSCSTTVAGFKRAAAYWEGRK